MCCRRNFVRGIGDRRRRLVCDCREVRGDRHHRGCGCGCGRRRRDVRFVCDCREID